MVDQAVPPPRTTVAVGLNNFRGVVQTVNDSCILKFFCCSAADGGCPGSTAADRAGFGEGENEYHLFNIAQDRFELPSSELRGSHPELVRDMAALLPPPHQTAPNNDSRIPSQGFGYRWPGCGIAGPGAKTDDSVAAESAEYVVYVEASWSGTAGLRDGSAAAPFGTIDEARDHLRALRSASAGAAERRYRIVVGSGTYAPLHLDARDSGSPSAPLIIEANPANAGPAVISGGTQIPKSSFHPWAGHQGIVKADLSSLTPPVGYGSLTAGGDCGGDCTG